MENRDARRTPCRAHPMLVERALVVDGRTSGWTVPRRHCRLPPGNVLPLARDRFRSPDLRFVSLPTGNPRSDAGVEPLARTLLIRPQDSFLAEGICRSISIHTWEFTQQR